MFQRMMLYFTLGLVLMTLELSVISWQFWSILALFWAAESLTRRETEPLAMAKGISTYLEMSPEEQKAMRKAHEIDKKANNG